MVVAFVLGLMGSLGHCLGMCSGVVVLLSRRGGVSGWRLPLAHLGRIATYGMLGLVVGTLGHTVNLALPGLRQLQGTLALGAAGITVYLALALLGRASSPEIYLVGLTSRWGQTMQRLMAMGERRPLTTDRRDLEQGSSGEFAPAPLHPAPLAQKAVGGQSSAESTRSVASVFVIGLLWGLLPCGLVLTALLAATATGSPWRGALAMLAFGAGTWPALLGTGWLAGRDFSPLTSPVDRWREWPRQIAALVMLLFGAQMALRGLAAWGWVDHLRLGDVMIW